MGLSAMHRPTAETPQWRLKVSKVLKNKLLSSELTRLQLASKLLYVQLDEMTPEILSFFYGGTFIDLFFHRRYSLFSYIFFMLNIRY